MSEEEEDVIGAPHHLSWIMFVRIFTNNNDYLRIITYINVKLISLHFLLRKDIS